MSGEFALIIGNSEYQDAQLARLVAPEADVEQLAAVLRDREIGGFDEVKTLVNEPSFAIRRQVALFFKDKKPDDLLLLYFSGHGVRDDQGSLYLAVKDTEHDLLAGTAIPAAFITGEMDSSRSRRQVLILDCCHSGAFALGAKGVPGESVGTAAAFQGIGAGRVVLTATDATQYAWEGEQVVGEAQSSVFTKYLINGLKTGEADTAGDGWITIDELYDYVYQQVISVTPKQVPGKWSYKQQGDIILARNPHPVVRPAELPPELHQSLTSPLAWVREGAVQELSRLLQSGSPGLSLAAYQALKPLTEDDSRRVANAATQVVTAYEAQVKARAEEEENKRREREQAAARLEAERLGAQRLAREQAERLEAERLAREQAEHARLAQEKAEAERRARERERLAQERAEAERVAREREEKARQRKAYLDDLMRRGQTALNARQWAEAIALFQQVAKEEPAWQSQVAALIGRAERESNKAEAAQEAAPIRRAAVPAKTIWLAVLLTAGGWGIAYALGWGLVGAVSSGLYSNLRLPGYDLLFTLYILARVSLPNVALACPVAWGISGAVGGFLTARALRQIDSSISSEQQRLITIGWALGCVVGLGAFLTLLIKSLNPALNSSDAPLLVFGAIANGTWGIIGGVGTGLALRRINPAIQRKQIILTTIAWAIGSMICWYIAYTFALKSVFARDFGIYIPILVVSGSIAGGLGGGVMFWLLGRTPSLEIAKAGEAADKSASME